jgi:hypothetical protein
MRGSGSAGTTDTEFMVDPLLFILLLAWDRRPDWWVPSRSAVLFIGFGLSTQKAASQWHSPRAFVDHMILRIAFVVIYSGVQHRGRFSARKLVISDTHHYTTEFDPFFMLPARQGRQS